MATVDFGNVSIELTKALSVSQKKAGGIYFTPRQIIRQIFERISLTGIQTVLEPSCGSMEFIRYLEENSGEEKSIVALEKNETIYKRIVQETFSRNRVSVVLGDFLTVSFNQKFDLIIGNPPFFVLKRNLVPEKWLPFVRGRPNIFALFILRALELLNTGGILAFVLPNTFLNSAYYEPVRKLIVDQMTILDINYNKDVGNFMGTAQETCSFIVRNSPSSNSNWVFQSGETVIFSTRVPELMRLKSGATTLRELHCSVYIGKVVWNTVKDLLTNDASETLLIYSSDISQQHELAVKTYTNLEKKNYIRKPGNTRPLIVVNRGYGTGDYQFNWAFINLGANQPFLVENHLICIESVDVSVYQRVLKSFADERTTRFIACYFGNGAISANELEHVLPIY